MNALLLLAALSGAMAVAGGAFGAHGASESAAILWKTGGQYQLAHAIAALVAIQMGARGPGWLFINGGALFGCSLYALALGAPRWIGAITPVGGITLVAGWLWLAWSAFAQRR